MPQRINGYAYNYSSIKTLFQSAAGADVDIEGFKDVDFKEEKKVKKVYGTPKWPIGRTPGVYDATGSITMLQSEWDRLCDVLTSDGTGYLDAVFDIVISMAEQNQPTRSDVLGGCQITGVDRNYQQGDEPNLVKLDLDIIYISDNGRLPLTDLKV